MSEPLLLTFKYLLLPEKRQHRALERILEQQRQLYIACLHQRIEAWKKSAEIALATIHRERAMGVVTYVEVKKGEELEPRPVLGQPQVGGRAKTLKVRHRADLAPETRAAVEGYENAILAGIKRANWGLSEGHQSKELTEIRADDPDFAVVPRRIQRMTLKRLERAYKTLFSGGGFPRFPGREFWQSFGFDAYEAGTLRDGGLRFKAMPGKLRVYLDRPLPEFSDPDTGESAPRIKGIHFKREGRRWFVGLQVEVAQAPHHDRGKPIGIDWGTSVLAALSTGEMVPNPRPGEALAKNLARAQRAVSRKRKGSKRRLKARRHLQAINRKIANRRRDHLDKVSKRLVNHFHFVAAEDLNVKGMMDVERPGETLPEFVKTRRNREALDAAPYLLRQMINYKALRDGADLVLVDPKHTTQECFWCGGLHFKELSDEVHVCTRPGLYFGETAPRKVNAARVILKRALGQPPNGGGARDRGGPVPGGAKRESASVCLGNTEGGQSPPGRRVPSTLASMRANDLRPSPWRLRSAPS